MTTEVAAVSLDHKICFEHWGSDVRGLQLVFRPHGIRFRFAVTGSGVKIDAVELSTPRALPSMLEQQLRLDALEVFRLARYSESWRGRLGTVVRYVCNFAIASSVAVILYSASFAFQPDPESKWQCQTYLERDAPAPDPSDFSTLKIDYRSRTYTLCTRRETTT